MKRGVLALVLFCALAAATYAASATGSIPQLETTLSTNKDIVYPSEIVSVTLLLKANERLDELNFTVDVPNAYISELSSPCVVKENNVFYHGALGEGQTIQCTFGVQPTSTSAVKLTSKAWMTIGPDTGTGTGPSITIDIRSTGSQSIGTFDKIAGENWTVDNHRMSIIKREQNDPDLVYIGFDELTEGIARRECVNLKDYRICLVNSSLKGNFDPYLGFTPYTYKITVSAILPQLELKVKSDKTSIYYGQTVHITIDFKNTGELPIENLSLISDFSSADVKNVQGPCSWKRNGMTFEGSLFMGDSKQCTFDARPLTQQSTSLFTRANFTSTRGITTVTGPSVGISFKTSPFSFALSNTTARLGQWVDGNLTINNAGSRPITFRGTIGNVPVNGTTTFSQLVQNGKSVKLAFKMRAVNIGNNTVILNGKWSDDGEDFDGIASANVIVPSANLVVKNFGQMNVSNGKSTKLDIELENKDVVGLRSVILHVSAPLLDLPKGSEPVDLRPGEMVQVYSASITPANDTEYKINLTVNFQTEFGQRLETTKFITLKSGKATIKALAPVANQSAAKPAAQPATQGTSSTQPATTGQPAPAQQTAPAAALSPEDAASRKAQITKENIFIVLVIFGIIGVAAVFLILNSRKGDEFDSP